MSSMQASKDCARERCPGTALYDEGCRDYVCGRCGHHIGGKCSVCGRDPADEEHFTVDPEEAMRGT